MILAGVCMWPTAHTVHIKTQTRTYRTYCSRTDACSWSHTHTHTRIHRKSVSLSSAEVSTQTTQTWVLWRPGPYPPRLAGRRAVEPQSSVRGQSWSQSCITGSWGHVDWQRGNTDRPGSNPHPSGIVGVKDYIQSGSIGHRWMHIDGTAVRMSSCGSVHVAL